MAKIRYTRYKRSGNQVMLDGHPYPVTIAIAVDIAWAKIIVDDLNRERQK